MGRRDDGLVGSAIVGSDRFNIDQVLVRMNYRLTLGYRSRIAVYSVLQLMTMNDQRARAEMMIYT